jgi:hypothetical protein
MGFNPTTPVSERANTIHALDRAATVIGKGINGYQIRTTIHTRVREVILPNVSL